MEPAALAEWLEEVTEARNTIAAWGAQSGTHPQLQAVVGKLSARVEFLEAALARVLAQ